MTNYHRSFSSGSPVLTVSMQPHYQTQLSASTFGRQQSPAPAPTPALITPADASIPPPRSSGRKRSRDEASINLDPAPKPSSPESSREDWVYGEGMVLIKPGQGYVADASSQSGTWLEEKNEQEQTAALQKKLDENASIRSRKLQRLDEQPKEQMLGSTKVLEGSPGLRTAHGTDPNSLVIDKFTLYLGIGWRKISDDEHIQAAARGWARFIENSFGLSKVTVYLESKGLQSYFIEAEQGYYLFAENLRCGRFVSRSVDEALQHLQQSPPVFEGPELHIGSTEQSTNGTSVDSDMMID